MFIIVAEIMVSLPLGIGYALIQFSQANSKKSSHGSVVSDNDANIWALNPMRGLELQIFLSCPL